MSEQPELSYEEWLDVRFAIHIAILSEDQKTKFEHTGHATAQGWNLRKLEQKLKQHFDEITR